MGSKGCFRESQRDSNENSWGITISNAFQEVSKPFQRVLGVPKILIVVLGSHCGSWKVSVIEVILGSFRGFSGVF